MTIKRRVHSAANNRSVILSPLTQMVDNTNEALVNKAMRCKSDSELITRGIKFTYNTDMQKSSVAMISSTSIPKTLEECPSAYIQSVLAECETDEADSVITQPLHQSDFIQPTTEQIEAYSQSNDAIGAVRACDVDKLRQLLASGVQLQICNKYGESLLHMACRRSNKHVVSFLLHEAQVSPRIRDDYGRTPLHDACWRGNPEYEIVEMLLKKEPRLAFVEDVRGHRPFQYARREHWPAWKEFLSDKVDLMTGKSSP